MMTPRVGRGVVDPAWGTIRRSPWLLVAAAVVLTVAVAGAFIQRHESAPETRAPLRGAAGGGVSAAPVALGTPSPHLVVVMLENKEFGQVVGSTAAPYFNNTLVPSGRLYTAHYASSHPSLPNYLVLTSGQYGGCVTDSCPTGSITGDNLFSAMNQADDPVTWKVYAEGMPSNCYRSNSSGYLVRHNPPPYYSNLQSGGDGTCSTRDVPLTALSTDLQQGGLPDFSMVVPNQWNDMHTNHQQAGCLLGSTLRNTVCQGDKWLQTWIPQLVSDGGLNHTTVISSFDEGTSNQGGAGRVVLLEIGPNVCAGCPDSRPSNHYGLSAALTGW